MQRSKVPKDVDGYIATAPEEARASLAELRQLIRTAAPGAEEVISYHMPYYKQGGVLVGFAAFKDHVSLFGAIPDGFAKELKSYTTGRGSVQFPYAKPLPRSLITRLVKAHIKMNEEAAEASEQ